MPNVQSSSTEMHTQVPTQCVPWPRDHPKRASINNFGFGGANAHVIIDVATADAKQYGTCGSPVPETYPRLYVVSAKDELALRDYVPKLRDYLEGTTTEGAGLMRDLSYTLCCRRSRFSRRFATTASTREELTSKLRGPLTIGRISAAPSLQFVFTGQGAQWAQMGVSLMKYEVFAEKMREAQDCLHEVGATWSLIGDFFFFCLSRF